MKERKKDREGEGGKADESHSLRNRLEIDPLQLITSDKIVFEGKTKQKTKKRKKKSTYSRIYFCIGNEIKQNYLQRISILFAVVVCVLY